MIMNYNVQKSFYSSDNTSFTLQILVGVDFLLALLIKIRKVIIIRKFLRAHLVFNFQ